MQINLGKEENKIVRDTLINTQPEYGVNNLKINLPLVKNVCREEVLSGKQISIQNGLVGSKSVRPGRSYKLNNEMFAVTDIGNKRNNQEDSVLILYHPLNPKYKMLVVADGMGGHNDGEKASQEIVRQMVEWFEKLQPEYMEVGNDGMLKGEWYRKLQDINNEVNKKYKGSGSTFVGAIVGEKFTHIASIGDSRGYIVDNNNELYQITDDDSPEYIKWKKNWSMYQNGLGRNLSSDEYKDKMQQKDNIRFSVNSHLIENCIGAGTLRLKVQFYKIPNNKYKTLMLFSDGVTDCLSDSQIKAIAKTTDKKDLARMIVEEALKSQSVNENLAEVPNYNCVIPAGKDNTSAVIYRNTEER